MRFQLAILVLLLLPVTPSAAQDPEYQPVATIGELMRDVIYPLSDKVFYVMREPPQTDYDWTLLRRDFLMLAESGNLLMIEGRSIPQQDWMRLSRELVDVSALAYEAAEAHDLDAIVALSPELEATCRNCHEQYHPRYGRRRPPAEPNP
jgi:hypothetical protein